VSAGLNSIRSPKGIIIRREIYIPSKGIIITEASSLVEYLQSIMKSFSLNIRCLDMVHIQFPAVSWIWPGMYPGQGPGRGSFLISRGFCFLSGVQRIRMTLLGR
jgi:hypothetical protein